MKRPALLVIIALTLAAGGCGSSNTGTHASHTVSAITTTTEQTTPVALEDAVRQALNANGRLSVYVLWANEVPSWASQSTGGPALAGLKTAVVGRRKQALRIRSLSNRFQVLAVQLDPSYTSATATVHNRERVALYIHGRRGRIVTLNEQDRIVLHRQGQAMRFVVWEVRPQK